MSSVPVQEIMDWGVLAICVGSSTLGFIIYPPLWIIPATWYVYWCLFVPIMRDSPSGYYAGPCRYDIYVHKKNEWVRM